jgi:hypothetical protein
VHGAVQGTGSAETVCGFERDTIRPWSWGNIDARKACLVTWGRVGWRRGMQNDPRFPLVVWAIARRPA